jgi:hypothetical protein
LIDSLATFHLTFYFKTFSLFSSSHPVTTKKLIMKLILFAAVVMFKCSRLSSAPADSSPDATFKSNNEKEVALNQPGYVVAQHPNGLAYVSNDEDLGTTGVVFQFRRSIKSDNTEIEARRRSALDKGFMRFGRAGPNMMRFGRSPVDEPDNDTPTRMRKNDKNMMRFGRAGNMLRFGRSHSVDYEPDEYEEAPDVEGYFMKSPDDKGNKILRLGRSSSEESSEENAQSMPERSEERLGVKKNDKNIMRFGRSGNMMRFGRGNVMRFGKRGNMMRFGRSDMPTKVYKPPLFFESRSTRGNDNESDTDEPEYFSNHMLGKRKGNLIRFGRNEKNLMRFGKRSGPQAMSSSTHIYCEDGECLLQENENQLSENGAVKGDQLQELFGVDSPSKQGYGEYIIEK